MFSAFSVCLPIPGMSVKESFSYKLPLSSGRTTVKPSGFLRSLAILAMSLSEPIQ